MHGWFYASDTDGESLWFWKNNHLGWLWSGLGVYPYIYSNGLGKWIYVSKTNSNKDVFTYYDFEQGDWVSYNL